MKIKSTTGSNITNITVQTSYGPPAGYVSATATPAGNPVTSGYGPGGASIVYGWCDTSGFSQSVAPKEYTSAATSYSFSWSSAGSGGLQTHTIDLPATKYTVTWQAGDSSSDYFELPAYTILIGPGGVPAGVEDPLAPPPRPTLLDEWEGREINVPIAVEGDAETVTIEVGGETFTLDVPEDNIEGHGVVNLSFKVPHQWDGSAKINGERVSIAPRIAYTGTPGMEYVANIYADPSAPLPPGMTRGVPAMPAGMTPQTYYGLPSGMTEGSTVTIPSGMSLTIGGMTGGNLPTGVTRPTAGGGSSTSWAYTSAQTIKAGATNGTTSGGTSSSNATASGAGAGNSGSGIPDAMEGRATDAGSAVGFGSGGDAVTPSAGLEGVGTQWSNVKTAIEGKVGGFSPMAEGSLPQVNSLSMTIPFGRFGGNRTVSMDFSSAPFPAIRAAVLVVIVFAAGWSFVRFLKV